MFGIFSKYCIEPASKYIFSGILNHCILTLLFATLFIFIKFTDDTFAVVEFPPNEPHPSVNDGIFVLYISPIAPWVDGELTIILPAFIFSENFKIVSSFSLCITAEWPSPPNSNNLSALFIPSSSFSTI